MEIVLQHALSPARLVILAWLGGTVTLLFALALDFSQAQELWLELAVLIWLVPLAVYDLRRQEVPHITCVAVPCLGAVVYSFLSGTWPVGVITLLAVGASERRVLRNERVERWLFSGALAQGGLLTVVSGEATPGAFAVLGFWLAYELAWWAGADALVAITLALLWPDIKLLSALGVAHIGASLTYSVYRLVCRTKSHSHARMAPCHLRGQELYPNPIPGLPIIGFAVSLLTVWEFWHLK
jgi:hypothetical protein